MRSGRGRVKSEEFIADKKSSAIALKKAKPPSIQARGLFDPAGSFFPCCILDSRMWNIHEPAALTCRVFSDHSILEGGLRVGVALGKVAVRRWRHVAQA